MYPNGSGWAQARERDLDSIPFPRWDLLPYDRYVIPQSSTSGRMRSCRCSARADVVRLQLLPVSDRSGVEWRFRSPKNVVDEMEHLVRTFQVEHILFRDPMFSMQKKRVVAICGEIVRRGLRVTWKCETRMDCLDDETLASMARAGCVGVNFGVESIDPEVQKGVHRKPILVDEFRPRSRYAASTASRRSRFRCWPSRRYAHDDSRSMEFAVHMRPSWTQFTVATPFVGTPMHDWAVKLGIITPDFYKIVNAHHLLRKRNAARRRHRQPASLCALPQGLLNRRGILKNDRRNDRLSRCEDDRRRCHA